MGGSNSRYISASDMSNSDSDEDLGFEPDIVKPNSFETDAALRTTASLPKAQDVLDVNKVIEIEKLLDEQDIVSLIYLLLEENEEIRYFFERLMLMIRGGNTKILSQWAEYNSNKMKNWQNKLIESLCIIKHYNILKSLGYAKPNVMDHFLPNNISTVHVDKLKKSVYLICDNLGMNEMILFLNHIKENFKTRNIPFEEINTEYLEIYFLKWECEKVLNLHEVKKVLKIMNQDHLFNILDSILPKITQQTSHNVTAITTERPSTSFEVPKNSQSLRDVAANSRNNLTSRTRKPSAGTSVDNNLPGSHIPYENKFMEYQHDLKDIDHDRYPVNPKNPGTVLIINQEDFYQEIAKEYQHLLLPGEEKTLKNRKGSDIDRDHLQRVFKKFGFKVIIKNSLNHVDLIESVKNITNNVKTESSLFICIMSHGAQGVVYGSNSCYVKVSKIQEIMSRNNRKNLSGKPKILILQSCQGQQCQQLNTSDDELETDGPNSDPDSRDMYTFWASIPGFAAIRNKKEGSWFIQALCNKMDIYGNELHFADICIRASKEVTEQVWREGTTKMVMTPKAESTLVKDFYLPKLEDSKGN